MTSSTPPRLMLSDTRIPYAFHSTTNVGFNPRDEVEHVGYGTCDSPNVIATGDSTLLSDTRNSMCFSPNKKCWNYRRGCLDAQHCCNMEATRNFGRRTNIVEWHAKIPVVEHVGLSSCDSPNMIAAGGSTLYGGAGLGEFLSFVHFANICSDNMWHVFHLFRPWVKPYWCRIQRKPSCLQSSQDMCMPLCVTTQWYVYTMSGMRMRPQPLQSRGVWKPSGVNPCGLVFSGGGHQSLVFGVSVFHLRWCLLLYTTEKNTELWHVFTKHCFLFVWAMVCTDNRLCVTRHGE